MCACWSATGSRACPMRSARCGTRRSCKHALFIFCGIRSSTPRNATGASSPKTSSWSTPPPSRPRPWTGSPNSPVSGETLSGDHPAVGERVGRIRPILAVRPGDKNGHLHHECDRVDQRPAAPRRQRPWPLPDRAGGPEVPVPGDHEPRPDRPRPPAVDQPVEGRPQRLRHHLRRPPQRGQEVTTKISYTEELTDPAAGKGCARLGLLGWVLDDDVHVVTGGGAA